MHLLSRFYIHTWVCDGMWGEDLIWFESWFCCDNEGVSVCGACGGCLWLMLVCGFVCMWVWGSMNVKDVLRFEDGRVF